MTPVQERADPNLARLLREAAEKVPHKTALICGGQRVGYQDLTRTALGVAHWFQRAGLSAGDRVAVHSTNNIPALELILGCFYAGLIAVPINTRLKVPEVRWILEQTRPKFCFSEAALVSIAEEAREQLPWLPTVRAGLPDIIEGRDLPLPPTKAPALILYTSGTTARPKGAIHTHLTLAASAQMMWSVGVDEPSVPVVTTPIMHASGLLGVTLPALTSGATAVLIPKFDPAEVLDAIAQHRCTFGLGLPAMMQFLTLEQEKCPRDVSTLRTWCAGGDSVPVSLQERFQRLFKIPLQEGLALSESLIVAWNRANEIRPGSIGRPGLGVEIRVVDTDGKDLAEGHVGELLVRSAANFVGYWNDAASTAKALQSGWLRTGELVRLDAEGYLWFEGRCKSVIIRGGSNVAPQEVEEVLYRHPAVMEVGVVGLPDEIFGERVVACVVLREGHPIAEGELLNFMRPQLADYKLPERILFLRSLPKGVSGKIQRQELREIALTSGGIALDRNTPKAES